MSRRQVFQQMMHPMGLGRSQEKREARNNSNGAKSAQISAGSFHGG
jgi:hypothetical protein